MAPSGTAACAPAFRHFSCAQCGREVSVCQTCDRRRRYCSEVCRILGAQRAHRAAVARHQRSDQWREAHRRRQREYRKHRHVRRPKVKSIPSPTPIFEMSDLERCWFCGRRVVGRELDFTNRD
jgi:hypothetical protein